jgi:Cu-Zn family superoxide dismutase
MNPRVLVTLAVASAVALSGCSSSSSNSKPSADVTSTTAKVVGSGVAVATIEPTAGNTCRGTVTFTQVGADVKVVADLTGLVAGQNHAMHVHETGDCSAPDAMSAGGHYNPEGHPHALPPSDPRHAGDLGNVTADAAGNAHYEITVSNMSVNGALDPVKDRAVIVHAKPDDGGQPVGNAGGRIGCGVIRVK